ncbi:unnamed protein product [Durusdinium trenchii]|uniref:Uncharacterized protein n=1 Tax=Durusdinium trenchii TaxID=1381693 RepID=A0ABP0PQB5_9DINO
MRCIEASREWISKIILTVSQLFVKISGGLWIQVKLPLMESNGHFAKNQWKTCKVAEKSAGRDPLMFRTIQLFGTAIFFGILGFSVQCNNIPVSSPLFSEFGNI